MFNLLKKICKASFKMALILNLDFTLYEYLHKIYIYIHKIIQSNILRICTCFEEANEGIIID